MFFSRLKWWINRHRFPDQAWFWTPEWQAREREVDEDLRHGRYKVFLTDEEFMEYLESRIEEE